LSDSERYIDIEQGSADWLTIRCGMLTSSRIAAAVKTRKRVKKDGPAEELAVRAALRMELISERLTGRASEHYISEWMKQGAEREPLARTEYGIRTGQTVELMGFIYHPEIKWAGCSPDGLLGNDGLVEYKCPKVETHIGYLIAQEIPEEYLPQLLWQLACEPQRQWNDFVSFCPELPEKYQMFRKRLERSKQVNEIIAAMEIEARKFLGEVEDALETIAKLPKEGQ
jgi:predicted phage-related endonuclease